MRRFKQFGHFVQYLKSILSKSYTSNMSSLSKFINFAYDAFTVCTSFILYTSYNCPIKNLNEKIILQPLQFTSMDCRTLA
jgi:hypothetical protein